MHVKFALKLTDAALYCNIPSRLSLSLFKPFSLIDIWQAQATKSWGVILFQCKTFSATSLITVNFAGMDPSAPFTFERSGNYTEQLHDEDSFITGAGQERWLASLLITDVFGAAHNP